MAKTPKTRQEKYEESGKRPGVAVGTRLEQGAVKLLDGKRGKKSRSAYVQALIHDAIGWNAPPKPPRKR